MDFGSAPRMPMNVEHWLYFREIACRKSMIVMIVTSSHTITSTGSFASIVRSIIQTVAGIARGGVYKRSVSADDDTSSSTSASVETSDLRRFELSDFFAV